MEAEAVEFVHGLGNRNSI